MCSHFQSYVHSQFEDLSSDVGSEFEILCSLLCVTDKKRINYKGQALTLTVMLILHNLYYLTVCSASLRNRSVTTSWINNVYVYWNETHIIIKKYYYVHIPDIACKSQGTFT